MSSVGLLFVGAVLLLDGLLFLGKADAKAVAVFNLFVGTLQTVIPFYLIATAQTPDAILGAAGIFLFGFTYLYVGIVNLTDIPSDGLGWFALWVAVLAVGFGVTNIVRFDDLNTGLLWLQWAVLWALFWAVLALGQVQLTALAGWLTVIQSVTTCTIPGFLLLLGSWSDVPTWAVALSIVLSVVALAPLARRTIGARASAPTPVPTAA
ncbi:MAG: hypothetical protein PGN13_01165 [Patulibacter minatonensis]